MDFPIFGQNPAMVAAAAQAAQIAPSAGDTGGQAAATSSSPQSASAQAATSSTNPFGFLDLVKATQHQYVSTDPNGPKRGLVESAFGDDGFGFDDVIAAINPLQQLPIISTIYRAITGDTIDVAPRLIGGAIYGGFFGFISAAVNAAVESSTGHDIGENVRLALFGEPDNAPRDPVMFAGDQPARTQTADAAAASATATAEPWYMPGAATAASSTAPVAPNQTALADAGTGLVANGGDPKSPALTAAQLSLLQEYSPDVPVAGLAPAAGNATAASVPPKPGEPVDLTPAQADLLMRSVGLKPPTNGDAASPAGASVESMPLPPGDAVQSSANADDSGSASQDDNSNDSAPLPQKPASPVIRASAKPGAAAASMAPNAKNPGNFGQRMQFGLDRYLAHRMPINPKPPHLDVIQ